MSREFVFSDKNFTFIRKLVAEKTGIALSEAKRDMVYSRLSRRLRKLDITSFEDLVDEIVTVIAMGDPSFVPAGAYGQQVLDFLGIAEQVADKLILGSNVREVLAYVETGNVDAGIVYSTDALISDGVRIVASAPDEINSQIVYPVAIIKASEEIDAASDYMDFLFSPEAMSIFEEYGFSSING